MKRKLSPARKKVLVFIQEYMEENKRSPTYREIGEGCGFSSTSTVSAHIKNLISDGYLEEDPAKHRSLSVASTLETFEGWSAVPILGRVAAGIPLLAIEDIEGYVPYKTHSKNTFFALRIKGTSMIDAGIMDGDLVIVEKDAEVRDKQIVIALIDDEATCKMLDLHEEGKIWLQPCNKDYQPIDGTGCTILGVVRHLSRDFPK